MNVLSLFDGMSCGQLALQRAGFEVDRYMACEIDKYTMQITRKNFPNTIQMGDVCALKGENLPPIDLLMGGSPCQGFSFAGKQLNFKDPRSALFFQFVRLLKETKPKYFLLENVRMKQEYQDVISEHLGVKPIMINSALVSAQNRVRLYWTNIPGLIQPEDKGIVLKDILEDGTSDNVRAGQPQAYPRDYKKLGLKRVERIEFRDDEKSNTVIADCRKNQITVPITQPKDKGIVLKDILEDGFVDRGKSHCLDANYFKGGNLKSYFEKHRRQLVFSKKVLIVPEANKKGYTEIQDGDCFDATYPKSKTRRGRNMKDKCNCLTAANYDYMVFENKSATKTGKSYALTHSYQGAVAWNSIERKQRTMVPVSQCDIEDPNVVDGYHYRKLTPLECERLQTVDDYYTDGVSNTQRYKMLGNGWTVDVICHIFEGIKAEFIQQKQEDAA